MKTLPFLLLFSIFVHGESSKLEEKILEQALFQTKGVMTDPTQRQEVMAGDSKAQEADAQLKALTKSPELTAQTYALASQILETLVRTHQGDVEAMMVALEKASRDPASFLKSLPEAQQKQVREIARKIESHTPRQ